MPNASKSAPKTNRPSKESGQKGDVTALRPVRGLPSDIIYHLGTLLPPADAAAFALSSKAIFEILGSTVLRLEQKEDRLDLLKRLEIYYPRHLLCHDCAIFHRRPPPSSKKRPAWIFSRFSRKARPCEQKYYTRARDIGIQFSFSHAQEVMNRHRFGKKYGVSPRAVEQHNGVSGRHFSERFGDRRRYTTLKSIDVRVVDDELYVRLDTIYVTPVGLLRLPTEFVSSCRELLPCRKEDFPIPTFPRGHFPYVHTRCNSCQSEWRFSTGRRPVTGGCGFYPDRGVVRITRWQTLGRCQDPRDLIWRRANECCDSSQRTNIVMDSSYVKYFDDIPVKSRMWLRANFYRDMLRYI